MLAWPACPAGDCATAPTRCQVEPPLVGLSHDLLPARLGSMAFAGPCMSSSLAVLSQAAERTRWGLAGGPWLRAQAGRWLWLSPGTLAAAVAHANQLLREFSLGAGAGPAEAAVALIALVPHEVRVALEQARCCRPVPASLGFYACRG